MGFEFVGMLHETYDKFNGDLLFGDAIFRKKSLKDESLLNLNLLKL